MSDPRYSIIPAAALKDERVRDLHLRVLAIIGTHTDKEGWGEVSQNYIGDRCGRSRETINRAIRDLVAFGYLHKSDRFSSRDGRQLKSLYQVVMDRPPPPEKEDPVTPASQGGCDASVTGGVTPGDHRGCDAQTSHLLIDPLFNDPPILSEDKACAPGKPKSVRGELGAVLDAERTAAVIDHRRAMRKPLTPHAARLLARKLGAAPDPNAAADTMIGNGWQGFEPEWLANRGGARRGPDPPRRRTLADAARDLIHPDPKAHDDGARDDEPTRLRDDRDPDAADQFLAIVRR